MLVQGGGQDILFADYKSGNTTLTGYIHHTFGSDEYFEIQLLGVTALNPQTDLILNQFG